MNDEIDILVTLDENYMEPLKVMLTSLYYNNPGETFNIWLIHQAISREKLLELNKILNSFNWKLYNEKIDAKLLDGAPTLERYPKEMYFRLLCGQILPKSVKRVLYLDPDILVINPLRELWDLDLEGSMIGAATHTGMTNLTTEINSLRLGTDHGYYNSGVMVIDLEIARSTIKLQDIDDAINKYNAFLILPDQDILNYLYGKYIKEIPEEIWNYDSRKYFSYYTKSFKKHNLQWVMENTSILHFCGRPKPWDPKSDGKFTALYLHYQKFLKRISENL
ncbi:glycosyltransferase family 8 protein [Anaerosphaera multitolerans]|uniref:Glycosyltransferase family 8 protein n=1 Tax=Anaerosphaera multitolerans TaxID=2487351 RepID=A0A437S4K0_9FIRM|nr:glycosyltransferase family 8 protein [Anaerosphaera multitolerans]RVU53939.1 glycosyltransferase family 8 protein [Anaerosphaera multitolerans]